MTAGAPRSIEIISMYYFVLSINSGQRTDSKAAPAIKVVIKMSVLSCKLRYMVTA